MDLRLGSGCAWSGYERFGGGRIGDGPTGDGGCLPIPPLLTTLIPPGTLLIAPLTVVIPLPILPPTTAGWRHITNDFRVSPRNSESPEACGREKASAATAARVSAALPWTWTAAVSMIVLQSKS